MKIKFKRILLPLFLVFLITGCPLEEDVEYVAEIRSDTHWKAEFGRTTIDGFGDRFLKIPPNPATGKYELPVCVSVQKQSIPGYLRARVVVDGVSVLGSNDGEWVFTTADSGMVIACSKGGE
jgi:hypothetical protein